MRFLRSGLIEVLDIGTKDTIQLLLVKDVQVIETLSPHTAQEALTDRIGSGCSVFRHYDSPQLLMMPGTAELGAIGQLSQKQKTLVAPFSSGLG